MMNTNFLSHIGLTRLGTKPEFTAPKADALTTWPSKLAHHQSNTSSGARAGGTSPQTDPAGGARPGQGPHPEHSDVFFTWK